MFDEAVAEVQVVECCLERRRHGEEFGLLGGGRGGGRSGG